MIAQLRSIRLRPSPRVGISGLVALLSVSAFSVSCDVNEFLSDIFGIPLEPDLSGQNAFVHLERSPSSPGTDIEGVLAMIEYQEARAEQLKAGETGNMLTAEVVRPARAGARLRAAIRPENFQFFEIDELAGGGATDKAVFDPIDLNALETEYVIPRLNAIPVRNQAARGTCAAFAGVGAMEYAALHENPALSTLDLSEQRFYFTSKPECQSNGCTSASAGSWYGTGFDASLASSSLDIPLEADCPYNPNQNNGNEVQAPQATGCSSGAARVLDLQIVVQPSQIIEQLEAGFPVPFASPLSDNYFSNSGIITLAAAGPAGNSIHAGGHAYLLVGYRKLPSMPEEGGMCFIVKNSWGAGWGVNGFSCITLAWMQEYHFGYAMEHPVVVSVELRDDLAGGGGGGGGDDTPPDWADCETYQDETVDCDRLDDEQEPIPDPQPVPPELVWSPVVLAGPAGEGYNAEMSEDGANLHFRGRVRGANAYSGMLTLDRSGSNILAEGDVVGSINGGEVILCAGQWDPVCSLRFEPRNNTLYLEWLYPEFRPVRAEELPSGQWEDIVPVFAQGLGMEVYRPQTPVELLLSPLYIRMRDVQGQSTDPVRLTVSGFQIRAMGQQVGSLDPTRLGLCSGDFKDNCSVFTDGRQLLFLPNW